VTSPPQLRALSGRLLGVDAGGSATRAVLLEAGQVRSLPDGPPMNALLTKGFADELERIIAAADPTAAGIGLPGVRSSGQARELGQTLTRRTGRPVHVTDDADTARAGAFLGAPGIVVMAGTGSVALGSDGERFARAGGHGFLLGDEGSAYWIGREAVRAALRWQEQSGGSELIHRTVTEATVPDLDVLITQLNAHPTDRSRLAALAPAITAQAAPPPRPPPPPPPPVRGRASRGPRRVHPPPPRPAPRRRRRRRLPRPGHLGPLRRPDRRYPPAGPSRGRRRPPRRHLYPGIAEPGVLPPRPPVPLEHLSTTATPPVWALWPTGPARWARGHTHPKRRARVFGACGTQASLDGARGPQPQ